MFRLEIEDNDKAQTIIALVYDGWDRWVIRLNTLIKEGKEHTNQAAVARQMIVVAEQYHKELLESFILQMDAEAADQGGPPA